MGARHSWIVTFAISILLVASALPENKSFSATAVHRINAGGGGYTDSLGQVWQADQGFNTGNTFSTPCRVIVMMK